MPALTLAPYAAALGLLYLWLSIRITGFRRRHLQAFGDNGDDAFQRAIRAQANLGEYAPFTLFLLYLLADLGTATGWVHLLATLLLLGRLSHAYSLIAAEPRTGRYYYRVTGMVLTFLSLGLAALSLLGRWFQFHFPAFSA